MKKRIYLVRHGEKVKKIGDPQLSEKGNSQAKTTGKYFKGKSVDKIVSSPILRAIETSQYIASTLNIIPLVDCLLKERVNWGDDPNQSFEDFLTMWKKASSERDWMPPVGDSSIASGERLKRVIKNIEDGVDNVILVTHGGIITDFLRNEFSDEVLDISFPNFSKLLDGAILECSITIIDYDPTTDKFELIELASVDHLKDS